MIADDIHEEQHDESWWLFVIHHGEGKKNPLQVRHIAPMSLNDKHIDENYKKRQQQDTVGLV